MIYYLRSELCAALGAESYFLSVLADSLLHSDTLVTLIAVKHDLGSVHSALDLDDSALFALLSGLDVTGYDVDSLDDDLPSLGDTSSTFPFLPLSSPEMTITVSSFFT